MNRDLGGNEIPDLKLSEVQDELTGGASGNVQFTVEQIAKEQEEMNDVSEKIHALNKKFREIRARSFTAIGRAVDMNLIEVGKSYPLVSGKILVVVAPPDGNGVAIQVLDIATTGDVKLARV